MPPSRPPITHFLCLPLVTTISRPQWQASLQKLTDDVVAATPSLGITARAVRPLGTLHLTFGILSLETEDRRIAARDLLSRADIIQMMREKSASSPSAPMLSSSTQPVGVGQEASRDMSAAEQRGLDLDPAILPFATSLSGLHPMHSTSSTSVLYASPADPTSRLHNLCTGIAEAFESAGLLIREDRPLLLHATIVNTLYDQAQQGQREGKGKSKNWQCSRRIDATELVERYAGFEWVRDIHLERVSVCKMGPQKIVHDGTAIDERYEELCYLELP